MTRSTLGHWVTEAVNSRYAELAARSAQLVPLGRLHVIGELVERQARLVVGIAGCGTVHEGELSARR